MSAAFHDFPSSAAFDTRLWQAIYQATGQLVQETDLTHVLEGIVGTVRHALGLDRVGIFYYDPATGHLTRLVGVDERGHLEYRAVETLTVSRDSTGPLQRVVLGTIPYFHSHDVRVDLPHIRYREGIRAHAIVPLVGGGKIIGAMAADNLLTGRDIDETLVQPLCLFGHFAAFALQNALRQQELAQAEAAKRQFYREVFFAVTDGKLVLCDREEIERGWPSPDVRIEVRAEPDVRAVREAIQQLGGPAGMDEQRLYDLGLCASEAATNALKHGEGGWVELVVQDGKLRVRVEDRGAGIESFCLPRATLLKGFSTRASMGLGFTIMKELADRLHLYTGGDGTTLVLEMALQPVPAPLPVALLDWAD